MRYIAAITFLGGFLLAASSFVMAHRSGCHRWHSCPSDTGSYVCGDLGYCSGCPDNRYCLNGLPRKLVQPVPTPSPTPKSTPVPKPTPRPDAAQIVVEVDGARLQMDVPPIIEQGRTLVPVRAIFEALGARVEWDSEARKVTATRSPDRIILTVDSRTAVVNNKSVTLDVSARIVNNRVLVPIRFVSEALTAEVIWNEQARKVTVKKPSSNSGQTRSNCDPSYPDVCIPPYPPDLDCKDIPYKRFRVLAPDPHGFDRDRDGVGCEK